MTRGRDEAKPAKRQKIQTSDSPSEQRCGRDLISTLPDDCLSHIFTFLGSPRDRCSCAAVSRRWLVLQALLVPFYAGEFDGRKAAAAPRRFLCRKANDARLAAMAVGSTRSGSPSAIHIQPFFLHSSFSAGISDLGLSFVSVSCKNLESLTIWNCARVGDRGLASIAQFCSKLKKVDISNVPKITDSGLISIAKACRKLSEVRVETCPLVGDGALRALAEYSAEIKTMVVKNCPLVGTSASVCFPSSLSNLSLTGTFLSDPGLVELSNNLTKLQSLELEKCHEVTSEGLMTALSNLSPSLRALSLVKCNGVGRTIKEGENSAPGHCQYLQSVTINACPMVCDEFLYSLGKRLVGVKSISLVNLTEISDCGFVFLLVAMRQRDALRNVDLSGCTRITDWSVAAAVRAATDSLRCLTLDGCDGVTDRGLRLIGHFCRGLVELHLSGCAKIGDGGVAELLSGAAAAQGLPWKDSRLQVLSLEGCGKITDESLRRLEEMAVQGGLAGLNLKRCGGLTAAAVSAVRENLWWCDLIA